MHICIIDSWESLDIKPHTLNMSDKPAISILLSNNIKRLRKENQLTQEQLAERCGISTRHLSDIERSDAFPSPDVIEELANVLDVSSYVLFMPIEQSRIEIIYSQKIEKLLESEISKALKSVCDKISDQ